MKKLWLILAVCTVIIACEMPNDQIIAECKKCQKAGLNAVTLHNGFTEKIIGIQCMPSTTNNPTEAQYKALEARVDNLESWAQKRGAKFK